MTLKQFQQLLDVDEKNYQKQLEILGYDISKLTVKEMEDILFQELNIDKQPKYSKWFKLDGRKFKVTFDIEDLNGGEYAYFKQLLGEIRSDTIVNEEIVDVSEEEKVKKLFNLSHKILSVFLVEKTLWKKKLTFYEKQEMILNSSITQVVPLVFFLSKKITGLQKNIGIYYLNHLQKKSLQEVD